MRSKTCIGECGLSKNLDSFAVTNKASGRRKPRCRPCEQIEVARRKGDGFAERVRLKYKPFTVRTVAFTPAQAKALEVAG